MPEQGPDWFFLSTESCGGGTPDLGFVLEVLGYIRGIGVRNKLGESTMGPQGRRARPGGGGALHPCGGLETPLVHLRYSVGLFWSKNIRRKVSGQLDSVWYSFSAKLKNKEKTNCHLALG